MQVGLCVYGFLKHGVPARFREPGVQLALDAPMTVYQLLTSILRITTLDATVLINGKIASAAQGLEDGDDIRVFSPIAGG